MTARVLVAADLRGIASHGVARLGRYIKGLAGGLHRSRRRVRRRASRRPAVAAIDARNGIGQVVSELAMDMAIARPAPTAWAW